MYALVSSGIHSCSYFSKRSCPVCLVGGVLIWITAAAVIAICLGMGM